MGEFGGLGSSHTAPCGTAVPARPPTHWPHARESSEKPQWPNGPTKWGTGVLVLKRYARAHACVLCITIKMKRLVGICNEFQQKRVCIADNRREAYFFFASPAAFGISFA